MKHNTKAYLLNPNHKVTIALIGCGGTGSYILTKLALLNNALIALGHIGLNVKVWDPDVVEPSNLARQLFFESDIGRSKAITMIDRINWNFGLNWVAHQSYYDRNNVVGWACSNITISCVDTVKARNDIGYTLHNRRRAVPTEVPYYWIDCGNSHQSGQVILGSLNKKDKMPTFTECFPDLTIDQNDDEPSCSVAQSLNRQDLFINSFIADLAMQMLWTMFRYAGIDYRGVYFNLETMEMNKIPIQNA
jgi:PRTRC genetic system ThiF family protein